MRLDVVEHAEVDEREARGRAPLDLGDGSVPRLEIEFRRWARWHDELPAFEADPGGIAGIERAVRVEVGHVMPRVAGSRKTFEPHDPVAHDVDVRLGDRREFAPQLVERVAVEPPGAGVELRGIHEVRRADRGYVDLQRRMLTDEDTRGTGVVEVDVREEEVPDVGQLQTVPGEAILQGGDAGRRPAVEERRPIVRLQQVAGDDSLRLVVEVDRPRAHTNDPR